MEYVALLIFALINLVVGVVFVLLNKVFGWGKREPLEDYPYECGVPLYGENAQTTFHQGYYLLAILLILFDIEAAFLFPWTVSYNFLGLFGFFEMLIFLLILTYGLLYAWRKGALDWQFEVEEIGA